MAKNTFIAVGSTGTAIVSLSDKAVAGLKLNEANAVCAKVRLTDEQFEAYKAGRNCGALWVDSASWLSGRDESFWFGTIDKALELGLVRKAVVTVKQGDKTRKLSALIRSGWEASQKNDHSIAIEKGGVNGRIETRTINDKRNALYVRRIESIELV